MREDITILFLQDGDRRWAEREGKTYAEGYQEMANKLAMLVDHLSDQGIKKLYVPANSIANLKRPKEQVDGFFTAYLMLPDLFSSKVRIKLLGDFDLLPERYKDAYRAMEEATKDNDEFVLYLLLNWSTLDEIPRVVKAIQKDKKEVTKDTLLEYSDIAEPIDFIIRSGKRQRLSSFVPLSAQYAEIYFMDVLFPDITVEDIDTALDHFTSRERTFGK